MKSILGFAAPTTILVATLLAGTALAQTSAPSAEHPCVAALPEEPPSCWDSLDSIWCNDWLVDTDYSVKRTYYLCPGTYTIGEASTNDARDPWFGGERAIFLTPNVEIVCGDGGVPSNDCVVSNGVYQVQAYSGGRLGENLIQGITFQEALFLSVGVGEAATQNITFKDCTFRNNAVSNSVFLEGRTMPDPSIAYTFEDVVFDGNSISPGGGIPGMLTVNNNRTSIILKRVMITNNEFDIGDFSYAINTIGPLVLDEVCFENNVFKTAPVIGFPSVTTFNDVYGTADGNSECQLATDLAECFGSFDADSCFLESAEPSAAPSTAATTAPPSSAPPSSAPPTSGCPAKPNENDEERNLLKSCCGFKKLHQWFLYKQERVW
eukprot:scaffold541_cov138-Cylindrotheca_fusiformis.AAC.14